MSILDDNLDNNIDDNIEKYYTDKIVKFFKKNGFRGFGHLLTPMHINSEGVFAEESLNNIIQDPESYILYARGGDLEYTRYLKVLHYSKLIDANWKRVYTRINGTWEERSITLKDILNYERMADR